MSNARSCSVYETLLHRGVRAVRLENERFAATVLVDKGADIYELVDKRTGIDVLWKSPWGLRRPGGGIPTAGNSEVAWLEAYEGGWQEIFPNGGNACLYKGVEMNFHGEASAIAWDYQIEQRPDAALLHLSVHLARSPFHVERTMRIEPGRAALWIDERITNTAREPMDYMWGHHPAYGAPFLSGACRIDTNAQALVADDRHNPPHNPLVPGTRVTWPISQHDGQSLDLRLVPGPDTPRGMMAYLTEFADPAAWYAITNTELGIGVGLVWQRDDFPHAWLWQEMHASPGYPWYGSVYVMAIEPFTSMPGHGLVAMMEKTGMHRTLKPGATATASLCALLYEAREPVVRITAGGEIATAAAT
ncbi:MAG: hypothetical protein C4346_01565 [Chloroflexota bacterium]